jgi:uncharacterized protein YndB with AHSA1/START domain
MKNNLLFDFVVDKPAKTVYITREFDAPLSLVWEAFTTAEIIDKWIAPAPYTAKTKSMNFNPGGKRIYAMVSPEGNERWAIQEYTSINPKTNFKMFNCFADKDLNPDPNGSDWNHDFSEQNGITTVKITIYNESFERMEMVLEGFKMGFTMSMKNLEEVLKALITKS